ncbi:zinc-binding dehydrogenase [Streptomyces sp. JJ38]|uniref:zinc-binding dehydrogenase n=1 Tax=Streptomyces sp. JJ38 TaxID=2738128 RepID=UPI001C575E25|nr:zinc-binding dehydrogenase [Streptomyces sp. JJ38]MBW1599090.1 zinc-binding dehydrogenase [Streptomyces sp. JJ38]
MHAVRLHAFGPAENLTYERVPDPAPGPGQVLVDVAAAGVHLVDTALRSGRKSGPTPTELPTIPGREVAGRVAALGEGVGPEWLGRRVVAHLGMVPGGYAERAVTGVERLHVLPEGVAEPQAVAVIGTGRTAMGILQFIEPGPGDTVLVLAAAGGVGSLLVQYAQRAGARVIGAAGGPDKTAAVLRLGADVAVDYRERGWTRRVPGPVTHVLEGVGGDIGRAAVDLLAPGGTHLSYGYAATGFDPSGQAVLDEDEQRRRGVVSRSVLGKPMFDRIGGMENLRVLEERAMARLADGTFDPLVHAFPLAEAAKAHRALEERATTGKVVLVP